MPHANREQAKQGTEIYASEQPVARQPSWLVEMTLMLLLWKQHGWKAWLDTHCHVLRGRAGSYVDADFIMVILRYAVSMTHSFKTFCEELKPFREVLAGIWGRHCLPTAATISRWLKAVMPQDLETIQKLFMHILASYSLSQVLLGGIKDRMERLSLLFDVDGTRVTAWQRSLPDDSTPQHAACLGKARHNRQGREIGFIRSLMAMSLQPPCTDFLSDSCLLSLPACGPHPLLWHDVAGSSLRRKFYESTRKVAMQITPPSLHVLEDPIPLSRNQRAHRRLTWAQRLRRNCHNTPC